MIRFEPDTLRDALWRPIAMAAPDSGVYMEIRVPDLRFAVLAVLTLAVLVLVLRRVRLARPASLLLVFVWLSFLPWLATSGNGRYFLPVLLAVGPLCIAIIQRLPLTIRMRLACAGLLVMSQATVVALSDPRSAWGLAAWRDTYMEVELSREDREVPATYVLASAISYSLVAPLFHPGSHWIGLAALPGDGGADDLRAQQALQRAQQAGLPMKLLVPTVLAFMDPDLQPTEELRAEINRLVGGQRLALADGACRVLPSRTLASMAFRDQTKKDPKLLRKVGFWLCPLRYPVEPPPVEEPSQEERAVDAVFERLERACPRLFPPGESRSVRTPEGFRRIYPSADTRTYVLDDGQVWFKYWRALNADFLGQKQDVLGAGFKMDCNKVRGRSGLPWEREL